VFKNLFNRKKVPKNAGNPAPSKPEEGRWVKAFELELVNMEGSPTYEIKHQLSFGSEIGNVVIADPSMSARHCTFILQQEVISVLDHASVAGTMVNGKKIPSGKYIILEETDEISIGDLEVRIKSRDVQLDERDVPDFPLDHGESPKVVEKVEEEKIEQDVEEVVEEDEKSDGHHKNFQKKGPSIVAAIKPLSPATNSLVRVLAVLCDLLVAYTIFVIFYPFDEFKLFLESVPQTIIGLIPLDWNIIWTELISNYGFTAQMLQDVYEFFTVTFHAGPLLLIFFLLRLVSTLILGVSLSEKMMSVKFEGNGVWARFGGALRVIIGMFTWPLIIFDLPSIVSRRTFKEIITHTHTVIGSKFLAVLSTLLYLPLLMVMALGSPLIQGLELPDPISVNDRIDQRVRVAAATEVIVPAIETQEDSRYLKFQLNYNANEVAVIPQFKFQGGNNKRIYNGQLVFYHKDIQRSASLELIKKFDLKQLLGIGLKGNVFLFEKFPRIYNFVYASEGNAAFKIPTDEKAQLKFANEVISFIKLSLEFDANNALETMQTYTPLIKNFIEFKASFLSLLEYKDFDSLGFIKLGNVVFLRATYIKQKPFDLIIPLTMDEGRVFRISFDKREALSALSNKFYKFTMNKADWLVSSHSAISETMTPFQVYDSFQFLNQNKEMSISEAQALYGFYFERSGKVIAGADEVEYDLWTHSVKSILTIIQDIPAKDAMTEESPWSKLLQNFQDLNSAVQSKNQDYFGVEQSTTL